MNTKLFILTTILFVTAHLEAGETIYLNPAVKESLTARPVVKESSIPDSVPAEAQPTPHDQIRIGLWSILKLTDKDSFVDFGCGPDARVAIAAGFGVKSRCYGIEIDPARASVAKERVKLLGLTNVEIIEGDATKVDVPANVGFAYLYPDVLHQLIPNILKLDRFVSYLHKVPGLPMKQVGEFWYWDSAMGDHEPITGEWGGVAYTGRVCGNPRCEMCNSIQRQIQQKQEQQKQEQPKPAAQTYTDRTHKVQCTRKFCVYETWRTFADGSQVMLDRWRVDN